MSQETIIILAGLGIAGYLAFRAGLLRMPTASAQTPSQRASGAVPKPQPTAKPTPTPPSDPLGTLAQSGFFNTLIKEAGSTARHIWE